MTGDHWTSDDFVNSIYGVGPNRAHLDECPECRSRWLAIESHRPRITAEPEVSNDFLAAQRRMIYNRIAHGPRRALRFAPAFVAMLALLIALLVYRPGNSPPSSPLPVTSSDAQLTSDIYAMEQSPEPRAARAMHALFEAE